MTIGQRIGVPELERLPLLFRETFRDQPSVERGGATLVGAGTTFSNGLVLNGSGNLRYAVSSAKVLRAAGSLKLDVTLPDPAAGVYMLDFGTAAATELFWIRLAGGNLQIALFGVLVLNVAAPAAGRHTIILSWTSGATTTWVDGVSQGTSAAAFTYNSALTKMTIGGRADDLVRFTGTIHSFEIYGAAATAADEPHLRDGSIVSDIDLDKALVWLPGKSFYKRASDSKFVTEVRGRAGITEALMGSDGVTAAQFPSIVRPRGFSFDGGDQITIPDADALSFTTGNADLPFSIAVLVNGSVTGNWSLIYKGSGFGASDYGEYEIYCPSGGSIYVLLADSTLGGVIYVSTAAALKTGMTYVLAVTYSGAGAAGLKVYRNGSALSTSAGSSGSYTCMRNTAAPLVLGRGRIAYYLTGNQILPIIDNVEWSPLQVRALTARLRRLART